MKSASFILGIAVACIAAPALAKPAYVASTVNLRAAPGTGSEIVAKIPGGSLVDAAACDEGWCEISWQDKKGFAIQKALDMSGRVPQQRTAAAAGAGATAEADTVDSGPGFITPEPNPGSASGGTRTPSGETTRLSWRESSRASP